MRVTKRAVSRITAALLFAAVLLPVAATTASAAAPRTKGQALKSDALRLRTIRDIDTWAGWLKKNNVQGFVGEVGWPSDDPRWNTLAHTWFNRADAAGIGVTTWVAGEWSASHQMAGYTRSSDNVLAIDTARSNALVAEAHFDKTRAMRGVNVTGPELGAAGGEATSTFSNVNYGRLGHTYQYDSRGTYQYLASRGVRTVRMPFRWERVQRTPFGPLDADEMGRLRTAIHDARDAGLQVIIDMHNFAGYYLHDPATGRGVRRSIGSPQLPVTAFTDVWAKLANYFAGDPAVHAFALMNEPMGLAGRGKVTAAAMWERISQQAVNVIRATGDKRTIMVAGYNWSNLHSWAANHPDSWIKDPAKNFQYEAHQYFDANHTGIYRSYDEEVAAVDAQ